MNREQHLFLMNAEKRADTSGLDQYDAHELLKIALVLRQECKDLVTELKRKSKRVVSSSVVGSAYEGEDEK